LQDDWNYYEFEEFVDDEIKWVWIFPAMTKDQNQPNKYRFLFILVDFIFIIGKDSSDWIMEIKFLLQYTQIENELYTHIETQARAQEHMNKMDEQG